MKKLSKDELLAKAEEALKRVAGICEDEDLVEAKYLVEALRDEALYEKMGALAEAVSRRDPKDARNRRLYGQYLINTGKATAAIDLLTSLAQRLPKSDPEFAEAMGLLGRANKQIFFDAGDKADPSARAALEQAIAAYRIPFEEFSAEEHLAWRQSGGAAQPHSASRSADRARTFSQAGLEDRRSRACRDTETETRSDLVFTYPCRGLPRSRGLGSRGGERPSLRRL